jgi:hypothetical protein
MPTKKGLEWDFYIQGGDKVNSRNYHVWCKACIAATRRNLIAEDPELQIGALSPDQEVQLMNRCMFTSCEL